MITVLVKYEKLVEYDHPLIDNEIAIRSKVVEINDYKELNEISNRIIEVKTLSDNRLNIALNTIDNLQIEAQALLETINDLKQAISHDNPWNDKELIINNENN